MSLGSLSIPAITCPRCGGQAINMRSRCIEKDGTVRWWGRCKACDLPLKDGRILNADKTRKNHKQHSE